MSKETTTEAIVETVEDLERLGFNPEQVRRLVAQRAAYSPMIEQVESNREWRQLQLLRWLYRHGEYAPR